MRVSTVVRLILAGIVAGLIALTSPGATAGEMRGASRLVAFVSSDCAACRRFSSEALSDYWSSATALELPITVIDVPSLGTGGNPLSAPLRALPTFVVMRDGRELARIEGYPGRDRLLGILADLARRTSGP